SGFKGDSRCFVRCADDGLQSAHGGRLPGVRLRFIGFAEADPSVIGKVFCGGGNWGGSVAGALGSSLFGKPCPAQLRIQFSEADATQRGWNSMEAAVDDVVA